MLENYIIFIAPILIIPILYKVLFNYSIKKDSKPANEQFSDIHYYRDIETNKHFDIVRINIGLKSIDGFSFLLKNESDSDIYAKKMGISNEFQAGNVEFDKQIYIISDIQDINNVFVEKELQDLILSIFYDTTYGCNVTRMSLEKGKLSITLSAGKLVKTNNIDYISHNLLERLSIINDKLMKSFMKLTTPTDNSKIIYDKRLALTVSIFLYGILVYTAHSAYGIYHIDIEAKNTLILTALTSVIIISLFLISTTRAIGKSSRAHMLIANIVIFGGLGVFSTSYFTISYANAFFDCAPPTMHTAKIIDKYSKHKRRGGNTYWFTIKTNENKIFDLPASGTKYFNMNVDDKINVIEHKGYFNTHWVSDYTKI